MLKSFISVLKTHLHPHAEWIALDFLNLSGFSLVSPRAPELASTFRKGKWRHPDAGERLPKHWYQSRRSTPFYGSIHLCFPKQFATSYLWDTSPSLRGHPRGQEAHLSLSTPAQCFAFWFLSHRLRAHETLGSRVVYRMTMMWSAILAHVSLGWCFGTDHSTPSSSVWATDCFCLPPALTDSWHSASQRAG